MIAEWIKNSTGAQETLFVLTIFILQSISNYWSFQIIFSISISFTFPTILTNACIGSCSIKWNHYRLRNEFWFTGGIGILRNYCCFSNCIIFLPLVCIKTKPYFKAPNPSEDTVAVTIEGSRSKLAFFNLPNVLENS